jgi:hypothetical protein
VNKTTNPGGLPRGAGSMQMRGAKWWLLFRDEHGRLIQRNSGTADADEARRLLAKAALRVLAARAKEIRRIAYGGETEAEARTRSGKDYGAQRAGDRPGLRIRGRSVRPNSARGAKSEANQ